MTMPITGEYPVKYIPTTGAHLLRSDDEIETPAPPSQGSQTTEVSAQDETRQEAYQLPARAQESPDELAQDVRLALILGHFH
jgi:hypothetical protein